MKFDRIAISALLMFAVIAAGPRIARAGAGAEMTAAAQKLLKSLDAEQRAKAVMSYDDPVRTDWHYIPKPTRKGLTLRKMNEAQRELALDLLSKSLSKEAYAKAAAPMKLEAVLLANEKKPAVRDSLKYYTTIFGDPTDDGKWGYSFEGHHLSLNWVIDHGKIRSATPLFFGANPGVVQKDPGVPGVNVGMYPLQNEETLGFDLVKSLDAAQRGVAVISDKPERDLNGASKAQQPLPDKPQGLVASKMTADQKAQLWKLIELYMSAAPAEVAEAAIKQAKSELDETHFAWWGADEELKPHAYHVQGKSFMLMLYNTQTDTYGVVANHPHVVWRQLGHDFGE